MLRRRSFAEVGRGIEVDEEGSDIRGEVDGGGRRRWAGGNIPLDGLSAGLYLEPTYLVLSTESCCSNSE